MNFDTSLRWLAAGAILLATSAPSFAKDCNRACLHKTTDTFLAALVRHEPASAGLAANARYTENGVDVKVGEGLWKSAVKLGEFHRVYVDPVQGSAGFFGLIDEGGEAPAIASLRLRSSTGRSPRSSRCWVARARAFTM